MDEIGPEVMTVTQLVDLCCRLSDFIPIDLYKKVIQEVVRSEFFKDGVQK